MISNDGGLYTEQTITCSPLYLSVQAIISHWFKLVIWYSITLRYFLKASKTPQYPSDWSCRNKVYPVGKNSVELMFGKNHVSVPKMVSG